MLVSRAVGRGPPPLFGKEVLWRMHKMKLLTSVTTEEFGAGWGVLFLRPAPEDSLILHSEWERNR